MSYIVLARKYRPQTFTEVIGQEHIVRTLTNAIQLKRIAHAYLFSGPQGVGKTSSARLLAKALNCEKGISPISCNKCSTCQEIAESRSIDVLEIDGASNRGIDEIKQLRENVKFATYRAFYKIYIIDEVHMLTPEAFNALLKTLEEPPSHVIFIFATTQPHKIPLTILSRCQHFAFKRILSKDIVFHLKFIASEEKIKISEEALIQIANISEGSIRDSQSLLDQLISFCDGEINLKDVLAVLGRVEHKDLFNLTQLIIKNDIKSALELIYEIINSGYDITQFTKDLKTHFRNLLLVNTIEESQKFLELKIFYEQLKKQSQKFSSGQLIQIIDLLSQLEINLKYISNSKILLELAIIKLIKLKTSPLLEELVSKISNLEEKINQLEGKEKIQNNNNLDSLEKEKKKSSLISKEASSEEIFVQEKWQEIIEEINKTKKILGSFLIESKLLKVEKDIILIGFDKKFSFHKEQIEKDNNCKLIEQVINKILNKNYKIKCEFGEFKQEKEDLFYKDEKHILEKEPIIKKAIEIFEAKIVNTKYRGVKK